MIPSTYSSARKPRRWPYVVLIVLGAVVGFYFLLVAYWANRVETAIAEHRGASLDIRDYTPPPLATSRNAWTATEAAMAFLWATEPGEDGEPKKVSHPRILKVYDHYVAMAVEGRRASPAELADFREAVALFAEPLAILDEAMDLGLEARFPTDYGVVPAAIKEPAPLPARRLTDLLRARGELAASEGRSAEAWDDARRIFRLAHWVGSTSYSPYVTVVTGELMRRGHLMVQSLLGTAPADAATRSRVLAEAKRSDAALQYKRAFDFDRAVMFSSMIDPRFANTVFEDEETREIDDNIWMTRIPGYQPWLHWNAVEFLEWSEKALALYRQPSHVLGEGRPKLLLLVGEIPKAAIVARILTSDLTDLNAKRDIWLATVDQLEIALGLESFREKQGRYPSQLAEAGADLAAKVDPFSGVPYRYRPEAGGYRLYSLGINLRDDGGVVTASDKGVLTYQQGDLLWQVARQ